MKRKHIAIVIVLVALLGGYAYTNKENTIEYIQGETQIVEVEKEVETLQKRIERAITASSTEIESASQQAFDEKKSQMLKEIELEVTRNYREEIEQKEAELEEQLSF